MNYGDFLGKKFLAIIFCAAIIYSVLLVFSDVNVIYEKMFNFDLKFLPVILAIIFSSWMILFLRWLILLRKHEINITLKENLLVYLAGFALSVSPAKSGELIKSLLLKNNFNIKKSKTIPIIFLERFYDIIGTFSVAVIGITFLGLGSEMILIIIPVLIVIIFSFIYSRKGFNIVLHILNRIKFLAKFSVSLKDSHEIIRKSSNLKTVCSCSALTILFRLIEGIGIILILFAIGIDFEFFHLVAIYSTSVILGAISMSPGGLGVTEGSFAGLLALYGFELQTTLVLAIIIRFFTLWFGVIVGFISLKLIKFRSTF